MTVLPPGWVQAEVGDIATLTDGPFGSNLKTAHYVDHGPRVVRLQNIGDGVFRDERAHITAEHFEALRKHEVLPNDVVVASLGEEAPRAALIPPWIGPAIVKADCIRVRSTAGVEPVFLMWMLNSRPVRRSAAASIKGVGRPRLGLGGIRALRLPLPPLAEQRRIVAAIEEQFSRLDAAASTLEQTMKRLAVLRRSVFESKLADLPTGPLGDVAVVAGGHTPRGLESTPQGTIPFYKVGDMNSADPSGRMGLARTYLSPESAATYRVRLWPPGTLIFPKQGGAIATNKKRVLTQIAACDLNTMGVIPSEKLHPRFLQVVFETVDLPGLSDGSVVAQIKPSRVAGLSLPIPPLDEQRRIVSDLDQQLSLIDSLRAAVESAQKRSAALRRAILERAFRGELVPQDPEDEPASALLERIRTERAAAPLARRARTVRAGR